MMYSAVDEAVELARMGCQKADRAYVPQPTKMVRWGLLRGLPIPWPHGTQLPGRSRPWCNLGTATMPEGQSTLTKKSNRSCLGVTQPSMTPINSGRWAEVGGSLQQLTVSAPVMVWHLPGGEEGVD